MSCSSTNSFQGGLSKVPNYGTFFWKFANILLADRYMEDSSFQGSNPSFLLLISLTFVKSYMWRKLFAKWGEIENQIIRIQTMYKLLSDVMEEMESNKIEAWHFFSS
ncbi:hypothetical protein Lal_00029549 [Lupinus albus]|nr:hypothetical protein Lal_00029549 [Lupinus albus]